MQTGRQAGNNIEMELWDTNENETANICSDMDTSSIHEDESGSDNNHLQLNFDCFIIGDGYGVKPAVRILYTVGGCPALTWVLWPGTLLLLLLWHGMDSALKSNPVTVILPFLEGPRTGPVPESFRMQKTWTRTAKKPQKTTKKPVKTGRNWL